MAVRMEIKIGSLDVKKKKIKDVFHNVDFNAVDIQKGRTICLYLKCRVGTHFYSCSAIYWLISKL